MELKIFDYEAYNDEFQAVKDEMVVDAVGWNGRKISIIPLYNLLDGICPKAELMKLKPFDVIQFEETNIYESYLIVPLKVKQKYEVCLTNVDNTLKDFLLSYGLIKFEVTSSDGSVKQIKNNFNYFFFNFLTKDSFFICSLSCSIVLIKI